VSASDISYGIWAFLLAVWLVLWGISYLRPSWAAHPSAVAARVTTHPVVRAVVVIGFLFLGWHTFAR
jgi:hypothetical protein